VRTRLKLLVLGGTKFLGRAVVEAALARGHEPTLFNRGRTNPDLFPEAGRLIGDRDGDLSALEGGRWDAVVDPSGYVPRVAAASVDLLAGSVDHYVFVSSLSVYRAPYSPGYDEEAPLEELEDPAREEVARDYGALKAACERVVAERFPGRSAAVRAGLIVGPHDPTGRFTYWPVRLARGGEVLAPGRPERPWQFVDVHDLGEWLVRLAEERIAGAFNATGPEPGVDAGEVLEACRRVTGAEARLTWVDEEFLLDHGVGEWMELPLWVSERGAAAALHQADVSRAVAAGLRFRPLEDTVRDTLVWAREEGDSALAPGQAGLDPDRERELLALWHGR
jgi:2'-hydroxyisoflavone reductase